MTLGVRLAGAFALLFVIGLGAVGTAAFLSTRSALTTEADQFLIDRADEIEDGRRLTDDRDRGDGGRARATPIDPTAAFDPDAFIQLFESDGGLLGEQTLPLDDRDLEAARTRKQVIRTIELVDDASGLEDGRYRVLSRGIGDDRGLQVARQLDESERVLGRLGQRVLAIVFAVAVLAAGLGWLVARWLTRPLTRLADAAESVAETQDLDAYDSNPQLAARPDEVGRLAGSFDTMIGALATSRTQQHRLIQDAGHELRTPLTSVRTNLDFLERARDIDEQTRDEVIGSIQREVNELGDLLAELVELATDSRTDEPTVELALDELVADVCSVAERRHGRPIECVTSPCVVSGRRSQLDRAITNLVGNAHKFSPPDTPILISVENGAVSVQDHGPGIAPDDQARVFDRFYRSTATRTLPGSGLGLAIVAQIVQQHGGTVWARSAKTGGADVGFQLPVVSPR